MLEAELEAEAKCKDAEQNNVFIELLT